LTAGLVAVVLMLSGIVLMGWGPADPGDRALTQRWQRGEASYVSGEGVVSAAWWLPREAGGGVRADEPASWTAAVRLAESGIELLKGWGVPTAGWEGARLVSAWSIGLTWAMVMWVGWSLCGARAGWLSGLVGLALPGLAALGRESHPASLWVVATAAAVAGGMWAVRPMRPAAGVGRQAAGWGLCGFAGGVAVLTGGAMGAWAVLWPMAMAIGLSPGRVGHALGLVASVMLGTLMVLPWALTMSMADPGVVERWWSGELAGLTAAGRGGVSGIGLEARWLWWLLLVTLPWVVWVAVSLVQPFSTSSKVVRGRLMVAWAGLLGTWAGLLLAPGAESLRLSVSLMWVAVLLGATLDLYVGESLGGRLPRLWRWGALGHGLLLPAVSVGLLVYGLSERWLVGRGLVAGPVFEEVAAWRWWTTGGLMLTVAVMALAEAWVGRVRRAALLWVCWVVVGMAGCLPAAAGRAVMVFMYPG